MGSIIAQNLVQEKSFKASQISVLEQKNANKIAGFKYFYDIADFNKKYQADLVFIAIKPQQAQEVLTKLANSHIFGPKTIFISILAGKKIAFFEKTLSKSVKIVRSMPNLPIEDSQGIFTYINNKNITKIEAKKLQSIFDKFGLAYELKDEKLFDAATAIFGSGPAYIFLLQEIISEIAIKNKIDKAIANDLVKQLFLGSSLMSCNSELDFKNLKKSVTSKKGTTAAALEVLEKDSNLKKTFQNSIKSAIDRSRELNDD